MREYIRSLQHVHSFWNDNSLKAAWADPVQRAALIVALNELQAGARNTKKGAERVHAVLKDFPRHRFVPCSPAAALGNLEPAFSETDTWQDILARLEREIRRAEELRDELLRRVFQELRPIEQAWRSLMLFFSNLSSDEENLSSDPELHVFNIDGPNLKPSSVDSVENFIHQRNENLAFQDDISVLVVCGLPPTRLRRRFEELAEGCGLLLLSDLGDERSWKDLAPAFLPGGKYFFASDQGSSPPHVCGMSHFQLRPAHWFETAADETGLFGPSSLAFAAIASHPGFAGVKRDAGWAVGGISAVRPGVEVADTAKPPLSFPAVAVARDSSGQFCYYPCGPATGDADGILRTFRTRAVFQYLERCLSFYARQHAGGRLSRDDLDEFENKIDAILDSLVAAGVVERYSFSFVDKSSSRRFKGILDFHLELICISDGQPRKLTVASSDSPLRS